MGTKGRRTQLRIIRRQPDRRRRAAAQWSLADRVAASELVDAFFYAVDSPNKAVRALGSAMLKRALDILDPAHPARPKVHTSDDLRVVVEAWRKAETTARAVRKVRRA